MATLETTPAAPVLAGHERRIALALAEAALPAGALPGAGPETLARFDRILDGLGPTIARALGAGLWAFEGRAVARRGRPFSALSLEQRAAELEAWATSDQKLSRWLLRALLTRSSWRTSTTRRWRARRAGVRQAAAGAVGEAALGGAGDRRAPGGARPRALVRSGRGGQRRGRRGGGVRAGAARARGVDCRGGPLPPAQRVRRPLGHRDPPALPRARRDLRARRRRGRHLGGQGGGRHHARSTPAPASARPSAPCAAGASGTASPS